MIETRLIAWAELPTPDPRHDYVKATLDRINEWLQDTPFAMRLLIIHRQAVLVGYLRSTSPSTVADAIVFDRRSEDLFGEHFGGKAHD